MTQRSPSALPFSTYSTEKLMIRLLGNVWFWLLAFIMVWLSTITIIIAEQMP